MRVVLFDDETMEPLTVIKLPIWAHERLRTGERINFPVLEKLTPSSFRKDLDPLEPLSMKIVTVWFEEFRRNGQNHWFCFTRDSENSLKLKAMFLPGQVKEVQKREENAFTAGLFAALRSL